MNFDYSDKLIFWAEWYQKEANITRSFYLYYFPADNSLEIFDHTTKKVFLKRIKVDGYNAASFYVGAKLTIYGRQINITDYADTTTRTKLCSSRESTFCLLKPNALPILDKIIGRLNAFSITNCLMTRLTAEQALEFYAERKGDAKLPFLMEHATSGPVLALELNAANALQLLIDLCGPEDPNVARVEQPDSLRALFGQDVVNNFVHCAETAAMARRQQLFFFPKTSSSAHFQTTALLENTTLGIVKPHAVKDGRLADIFAAIRDGGMRITAMRMFFMERPSCEEFYELYKGVVPEYVSNVLELSSGPCVAMEIQSNDPNSNSYTQFRTLCGPCDVELAKQLRPATIRARFGVSKVQNAIHCTDLEEDTRLEIEYFFKILA